MHASRQLLYFIKGGQRRGFERVSSEGCGGQVDGGMGRVRRRGVGEGGDGQAGAKGAASGRSGTNRGAECPLEWSGVEGSLGMQIRASSRSVVVERVGARRGWQEMIFLLLQYLRSVVRCQRLVRRVLTRRRERHREVARYWDDLVAQVWV